MSEKHTIKVGDTVTYTGLFDYNELFALINNFFEQAGYDKRIGNSTNNMSDDKKEVIVGLKIWKPISEYIKYNVSVNISAKYKDIEIRIDDKPRIVQDGKVTVSISGAVITDYQNSWEYKPEYFFLRTLFNKFIYKVKMTDWDGILKNQLNHLKAETSSYLNLNRFDKVEVNKAR